MEESMISKLVAKEERELQKVAKELMRNIYAKGAKESQGENSGVKETGGEGECESDTEFEEWHGIQEDDEDMKIVEPANDESECMDDGDIDVLDSEVFVGSKGEEISREKVIEGLHDIWNKGWGGIENDMAY